jgi:hypothetical protein
MNYFYDFLFHNTQSNNLIMEPNWIPYLCGPWCSLKLKLDITSDHWRPVEKNTFQLQTKNCTGPWSLDAVEILSNLTTFQKEQLIELLRDPTLKKYFRATLLDFWIGNGKEYQELSNSAVNIFIGFSAAYLCERGVLSLHL